MAHKTFPTPTTTSDPNEWSGEDHNKLITNLDGTSDSDPFTFKVNTTIIKHSTTNLAGDLLKNDSTRYSRWQKGTAGQQIRVKSDGSDLEWFTPSTGSDVFPLQASYIIYNDGGTYKAKNGVTGAVHATTSTTNVAAVINAVIDELTTATGGGMIFITKGIFTQTTSIIIKNKIYLVGAGQSVTILRLANNTAIDQIESFNFASLTNTNSLGGVGQVTIRDLTIDGNQANQSGAGGYGIKKYGWRWFLQNVIIKNTKKSGIYSEWCTDPNFPSGGEDEGMDDHWLNVTVSGCRATNCAVQFRGPHDTLIEGLYIAWAPNGAGMICEGNTNYDGNCRLVGCHIYSIKPETQALYVIGQNGVNTYVSATQCDFEGAIGTGGVGVLVDGSAQFKGTDCQIYLNETGVLFNSSIPCELHGCRIFSNTLGVKLQTSQHFLSECLWLSNQTGVLVQSISGGLNLNRITGHFKGHTAGSGIAIDLHDVGDLSYVNATVVDAIKGIRMGRSGQSLTNCVIHLQAYNCTTAAIDWADTSNSGNIVRASIVTASAGHAAVTGTPNHSTNDIWIKSSGAGTNYNTQSAANADTSGAALAALETEVNELKAALRRYGIIAT